MYKHGFTLMQFNATCMLLSCLTIIQKSEHLSYELSKKYQHIKKLTQPIVDKYNYLFTEIINEFLQRYRFNVVASICLR